MTVNGGREFNGPLGAKFLYVNLGRGADYYRGHHPSTFVFAGRGADTVVTGGHLDLVFDNHGDDSIQTRGAFDVVAAVGGAIASGRAGAATSSTRRTVTGTGSTADLARTRLRLTHATARAHVRESFN